MASLCRKFKVGVELIQVKTNLKGRKLSIEGAGEVVGTPAAISAEITEVLERLRGEDGEEIRERMVGLGKRLRESRDSGYSRQAMERLGRLCDEVSIPA